MPEDNLNATGAEEASIEENATKNGSENAEQTDIGKRAVDSGSKKAEDFLIAEYQHWANSFWRSEEAGERRVNFLIVVVTASITVLTAVATGDIDTQKPTDAGLLVGFALATLLALGLVTLKRMLRRNVVSDEYKYLMDSLRNHFMGNEKLKDYPPFGRERIRKWTKERKARTGGLAEVVAIINSIVVAGLVLLLTRYCSCDLAIQIFFTLVAFTVAVLAQYQYMKHYYRQEVDKLKDK